MSISLVTGQIKSGETTATTSVTPTLPAAPTTGNYMVISVAWDSTATLTTPSGWTLVGLADLTPTLNLKLAFLGRIVQGTDTATGPACTVSASSNIRWTMAEYSGVNTTTPVNQSVFGTHNNTSPVNTSALTPSVLNTYPLAHFANRTGATINSFTSGWTQDILGSTVSEPYLQVQHGPLTSDTTTGISASITWGTAAYTTWGLLLLNPASASLTASPSSLTFTDPTGAAQTVTISGGTSPYSVTTSPNVAIATASLSGSTLTVTPKGAGSTSVVVSDSASNTVTITITVGAAMSLSPSSLTFTDPKSAAQTSTISGGRASYTASSSNTAIATVSVSGTTVTVTPVAAGSATITVTDADSETATIAVTVGAALSVSPSSVTFASSGAAAQTVTASNGKTPYGASSTNTSIATVSVSGSTVTITPVAAGSCSVNVTDADGESASVSVTVNASTTLAASPSSLTFSSPTAAAQTSTISGGTAPYSIETAPTASVATASLSGSTLTVTPAGAGGTAVIVQDSAGHSVNVDVTVNGALTLGNPSMTFGNPNAAAQLSKISGGDGSYSIYTQPNSSIAKAVIITGNALQVTPVGVGTTTVVVHDGSGHSVTQNVTVNQTTAQNTGWPLSGQGGYPAHVSVWSSQWANATLLTVLDCTQLSFQNNQFGGPGAGKFTIWSQYEDPNQTANLLAGNRIDTYLYRDTLAQSAASGATSITINAGTRFSAGDHICVYDGINQTFTIVQSISNNTLTISPALTSSFAVNTTVGTLRYRGLITARTRTPNLDYHTDIETQSYFQYQLTRVVNFGCNQRECGWLIYQLLNLYAGEIDLTLNPANFTMTTASDGSVNGTGTNAYYTNQVSDRALLSVIQDIIKTANGAGDTQYQLYIDANNVVYFNVLEQVTPNVTYTLNPQAIPGDGVADIVGDLQTRDQDLTNMYNVYKLTGGQDGSGQPVQVEVEDQKSVNQYGQRETYLSFPNITDEDTLKSYGKALLDMTAWPVETANLTLIATGAYATGQDLVKVAGFTDGSSLQTNVQSVETTWAAGQDVHQKLTLAELVPDKNRIMAQIAAQHYYANNGTLIAGVNLTDRFVQTGLQGSISGTDVFMMTAGTLYANVLVSGAEQLTQFNAPAFQFTPSSDGLWTVAYAYAKADGTQLSGPGVSYWQGATSPTLAASQYVPLYRVTVLGGVIVDVKDVRNMGGISTPNITPGSVTTTTLAPDPNLSTSPALAAGTSLSGPVYYNAGSGCYDAGLTFTLNVTNPSWMSGIRMFAVSHGQSFTGNAIPKGDYVASSTGVYEPVVDGLASGARYDLYVARVDVAGNVSAPLLLCTTSANPMLVNTSSLPAMPANTTPTIVGTPTLAYPNVGNGTYDCDAAVTLDSVGTTSSAWLQIIEAVAQPSGSSNKWTVYNAVFANSNGSYTVVYGGLGSGTQYQLGIRYVDFQGQRSAVSVVGTTAKNPIQGFLQTSILDSGGQLPYSYTPGIIKTVIDPNGTINVSPSGGTTGTLPYSNNGVQYTSTIMLNPDANGSYLQSNTVVTRNVQPVNILNTQLAQNRYSSNLTNTLTSAGTWYDTTTSAAVASNTVLSNGDQLTYDVGTAMDAGSANAAQDTLTLGANATVTLSFKHASFKAGGNGILNLYFTGGSVSAGANVLQSTTVSGSDQPTISHTTTSGSATNPHTTSLGSFTSSPSIVQNSGTSYNNVQHSGSAATASTSQASLSYSYSNQSETGPGGSGTVTATSYRTREIIDPGPPIQYGYTDDGTNYTGGGSSSVTLPSYTKPQELDLTISGLNSTYGSFKVTQYRVSDNAVLGSASGITSSTNLTISGDGSYDAVKVEVDFVPASGNWDGTGSSYASTSNTATWSSTLKYSQQGTSGSNGGWVNVCTTSGSAVAPVDAAHQLSLAISAVNAPSDANGATRIDVRLLNPSGGVVQTWTGVSVQTLTYSNASAVAGQYTWQYATVVTSTTNTGTSSYSGSITATPSWYQSDAVNTTSYSNNDGAGTQYQTASVTLAPTATATQLSLVISSLSCPSDANGSSELVATLTDPNGNVVYNNPITATGTYSYTNSGAVAGTYTWTLFGRIKTDNNSGASTYTVTAGGDIQWYQNDSTSTTTWYNNAGTSQSYTTPSNTVAPTAAATQLQLKLTSVTTPSNSAGTTAVYVTLKNPSGTTVYTSGAITAATTISYSNASAAAGTYTWTIWAAPTNNGTADSTYSCSWSGTHSWYQAGASGGNTYVLAQDGVTQRLSTTDANVAMTYIAADTVSFKIYNNAAQSVTCQVGIDLHGD